MEVSTGYTVNTIVLSVDSYNNPFSAVTFNTTMFQNGSVYTGLTLSYNLVNPATASFNFSWSASTFGDYQFYAQNNVTGTLFISDIVNVIPNPNDIVVNVYTGE